MESRSYCLDLVRAGNGLVRARSATNWTRVTMTRNKVINLDQYLPVDPILRRGDVVRLVDMKEYCEDNDELHDFLEGAMGIVTEIQLVFPDDHEDAPGQAAAVRVQVPTDQGWEEFDSIGLESIVRSIRESRLLRLE